LPALDAGRQALEAVSKRLPGMYLALDTVALLNELAELVLPLGDLACIKPRTRLEGRFKCDLVRQLGDAAKLAFQPRHASLNKPACDRQDQHDCCVDENHTSLPSPCCRVRTGLLDPFRGNGLARHAVI